MRTSLRILCGVSALVALVGCWLLTSCERPGLAAVCLTLPASLLVTSAEGRWHQLGIGPGGLAWVELGVAMGVEGVLAWSLSNPFTDFGSMRVRWHLANLVMAGVVMLLCLSVLRRGSVVQRVLAGLLALIPAAVWGGDLAYVIQSRFSP
jgi:hypothetical protein